MSEGAFPWFDRVGQWSLTNVPDNLKGSGPLPQGECSHRSLEVPGKPTSIVIGVQVNDVAKFTEKFPAAKITGTQIAVKNPDGISLPYTIFTLPNPPAVIDGEGVFGAGLLLLKIGGDEPLPDKLPSVSKPAAGTHALRLLPASLKLCEKADRLFDGLISPLGRLV